MKKRSKLPVLSNKNTSSKPVPEQKNIVPLEDDEQQGFSEWLRTGDGIAYMRVFVIINSFVVFLTMGWPHLTKAFNNINSFFGEY